MGGQPSGDSRVQLDFYGPIYGGKSGIDELVSTVPAAVKQRGLGMTSYVSVRKTTRRA